MKNVRRLASLILALVMVLAMATTAFAAETPTSGTITVTNATNGQTYKLYKLFDANIGFDANGNSTSITYTLPEGKSLEGNAYFEVNTNGNVVAKESTTSAVLASEDFRTWAKSFGTQVGDGVVAADGKATFSGVPFGYYYIDSSLGALLTVNSTNPNAEVTDKNTAPELDKKITGASSYDDNGKKALAQVGTDVKYEVTITIGTGAENYVFHDKMDSSLSYNNDLAVKIGGATVDAANYDTTTASDDTITVSFKNDYTKTLTVGTKITVTYSAKVTSDALTRDPAKNTAYLNYGHNTEVNSTPVKETEVYNAKFTVTKHDGSSKPLAGAGFVIKNADGKYYKLHAATEVSSAYVEWVDDIASATEYTSDANGAVPAFTGLANGTYTLVEKTVPAGYNKAADVTFTVNKFEYDTKNLEQSATVMNQAGSVLPSTGGMGTTLFYIVGGLMVMAAVVLLVTKKRMANNA